MGGKEADSFGCRLFYVLYVDHEYQQVIAITPYFTPTVFDRIDFIEAYLKPFLAIS